MEIVDYVISECFFVVVVVAFTKVSIQNLYMGMHSKCQNKEIKKKK